MATRAALAIVGYPKSSWYRHQRPLADRPAPVPQADRAQPHALSEAETSQIVGWLSVERFANLSVQQVFWRVFDEGHYVASMRTWYRVAARLQLSGDRRAQASHPPRVIPELVATGPNQVWSWDIERHEAFANPGGGGRPPSDACRSRRLEAGGRSAASAWGWLVEQSSTTTSRPSTARWGGLG